MTQWWLILRSMISVRCSQIRAKQSQATLARSNSHSTPCRRTPTTEGRSWRNDSSCWCPASKKNRSFSMPVTCLDMFRKYWKNWKMICCTFKSKYVAELSWCISIRMQVLRHFSTQMLDVHSTWNHKFWDQVQLIHPCRKMKIQSSKGAETGTHSHIYYTSIVCHPTQHVKPSIYL